MEPRLALAIVGALTALIAAGLRVRYDLKNLKSADQGLSDAEKVAFGSPSLFVEDSSDPALEGESERKVRAFEFEPHRQTARTSSLFLLYSRQIEKYQTQTQARAFWSFVLAIVAMVCGLGLVIMGSLNVISNDPTKAISAAAVTAIGGAVSAYITKTFLDVHELSLVQLNHYFQQPVINSHILTAQRIADQMKDSAAKERAYEQIVTKVVGLISMEPIGKVAAPAPEPTPDPAPGPKPKPHLPHPKGKAGDDTSEDGA